jgi:hypothetical protein
MLSTMNSILSFGEKLLDHIQGRDADNDHNTVTQNLNTAFDAKIINHKHRQYISAIVASINTTVTF